MSSRCPALAAVCPINAQRGPISVIKRSDPAHPGLSRLSSVSAMAGGSRFSGLSVQEDDSVAESVTEQESPSPAESSPAQPQGGPPPSPPPGPVLAVDQGDGTPLTAVSTSAASGSLNAVEGNSHQASPATSTSGGSQPAVSPDLDSLMRRKPRPPAGSRQSDLEQMAVDVVAMALQSWPRGVSAPVDANGQSSQSSGSFLQFLRHVTEYFSN